MFHLFDVFMEGGRSWRERAARVGLGWVLWTLVGLFFASQIYFLFINTEHPMTFWDSLWWQLIAVYLIAVLTPLVLWLARRFRIERFNWRRHVLVHIFAGMLIALVWSVGHVVLDSWVYRGRFPSSADNVARNTFASIDRELLIYWLIVLVSHVTNYYKRYREGELKASQAQLQALKMQLHPHFIFNALHSISTLVYQDPDAADRMIARLGDFLRLTLESSATQEVLLRQELEFLNCYLAIERIRFSDRLTTHFDVDPQALNCLVPNLILQPIVENAIRHGIATRAVPGHIEITATRTTHGMLRLQVRDDGPGVPEHQNLSKSSNSAVGLANTRERLTQLYSSAHRFELSNDANSGGAVVVIEIPFMLSDDKADPIPQTQLDGRNYAPVFNE